MKVSLGSRSHRDICLTAHVDADGQHDKAIALFMDHIADVMRHAEHPQGGRFVTVCDDVCDDAGRIVAKTVRIIDTRANCHPASTFHRVHRRAHRHLQSQGAQVLSDMPSAKTMHPLEDLPGIASPVLLQGDED